MQAITLGVAVLQPQLSKAFGGQLNLMAGIPKSRGVFFVLFL